MSGPSGPTSATTASFAFDSNEDGTFECKLDGPGTATGTYSSCSSPKTYSGLGAGSYTFSTRAIDLAENVSSPATRSFTVAPDPTPTPVPTGWHTLGFVHSGQALSVSSASDSPGAAIVQSPFGGEQHSQWKLVPRGDRGFEIVNRRGQCLDIWSESPGVLLQRPCEGGLGQRWEFDTVAPGASYSVLKNVYSGLVIDQAGATNAPGGVVIQWPKSPGATNERIVIAPVHEDPAPRGGTRWASCIAARR